MLYGVRYQIHICAAMLLVALPMSRARADTGTVGQLEEVVVTARKREENLQNVPVSIAAYSAAELKGQSVQRLSDLGQLTPNFFYGEKVQSSNTAGQVYIRGIGQEDTKSSFSPGVGIYVDGVYLGRAQASDLDMGDVERLEVLYGPQGTLFGKNTNGGAINIVTRKPNPSATTGDLELQTGNFGRLDAIGNINIPLVADSAALRVSAVHYTQEGYSHRLDGQDQANQNRTGGRARLLLKPAENLEALLSLDGVTFNEHGAAYKLIEVRTASPIPVLYATTTPYRYDDHWVTGNDFTTTALGPNRNAGSVYGASLNLTWKQPWGTFKSISAYRRLRVDSFYDPDASALTVLSVFNTIHQHQLSEELQATGTALSGKLSWVLGLYFFHETGEDDEPLIIAEEVFHGAANFSYNIGILNQNYSGYGQGILDLTEKLKLTFGGRVGDDKATVGRIQVGYPIPDVQQPFVRKSASWTSFLPRVGLDYHWTPDFMTYVSAAEGSKSGGFNGRAGSVAEFNEFEPEKVWTYEIGLRSDWFDKRLRLNATAFYSDYRDFQIALNRSYIDPNTGKVAPFSFVGNMPKARIVGGEFALTAIPVSGLTLSTSVGVADGKYLQVLPGAPVTTESQFVHTPKVTTALSAQYSTSIPGANQLVGRIDYVHKTTIQYDYSNSPLVAQRPYGLLNARLTLQRKDSGLSVALFGTNLTDTHYMLGGIDDSPTGSLGEVVGLMGAPREWGVSLRYEF